MDSKLILHEEDRFLRRQTDVFVYKGNENAISATFNYSVGNYSLKNITFQKAEDRPMKFLLV